MAKKLEKKENPKFFVQEPWPFSHFQTIFLVNLDHKWTYSRFSRRRQVQCTRGGAWARVDRHFRRRVGARPASGRRVVSTYVFVSSSRLISYIYTLGKTYSEDFRGQARLGGYDPAT
ncbi:uncharacterized protein LOC126633199 [Malus sylvestris]|uniref:uncharacterized protein LOC126633199 n=1 Tax=Malus sylvestris TaxID=3752 RepID=UPI0021AC6829|nr:uncharacterized protein LOC126633199 [Malus sylvestris]